jgi:hypothetical protein
MKNEDKLIELLAEYLQKTDRILDRLDSHDSLFGKQFQTLLEHSKQIESLQKESLRHSIHQEEILKEIFSISKRVRSLEDDPEKP